MILREHQEETIIQIKNSLRAGNKKPLVAAPCSFGKTVLAAQLMKQCQDKGKSSIFICDRVKLVNQTIEKFKEFDIDFSVIQAYHELYNKDKTAHIASIQSLRNFKHWPHADMIIIDECHVLAEAIKEKMQEWNNVVFIGLSATPYSKGLGNYFDDLLVPITPNELLKKGYLCEVEYFGGRKPDISSVKTKYLASGGSEYLEKDLKVAIEKDALLAGDVVENWIKRAENKMTIAFSPSIKHSKDMVKLFNEAGYPAIHIDGYMTNEEKDDIFEAHKNGEFLILSCSRLLNTGYDEPRIECLIDCFPTKSIIQYIQRAGRLMRIYEGKEKGIYLDHAGNVARHGFPNDIIPYKLDKSEKNYSQSKLIREKKEPDPKECPDCFNHFTGIKCQCGYEIPLHKRTFTDNQDLKKITKIEGKTWNKKTPEDEKRRFYGMLKGYCINKQYKSGWADVKYKERSGVWPKFKDYSILAPDESFKNWIKSQAIKRKYVS
jgi:DNA repair protein RadD